MDYTTQSSITDPGKYKDLFNVFSDSIPEIVNNIQGLIMHIMWAKKYGIELTEAEKRMVHTRFTSKILRKIISFDNSALNVQRNIKGRFVGNCRDYSVLLCSILRYKKIPARVRSGFAKYFVKGEFGNHWICEYFDNVRNTWIRIDPQLSQFQKETLNISFNTLDIPKDQFITGAEAWKLIRYKKENPEKFGMLNNYGIHVVLNQFLHDIAAINKIELLPWDLYGLLNKKYVDITKKELNLLDKTANSIILNNKQVYNIYKENEFINVPENFISSI